ncbi:MAG TPA: DUF4082 domain-containing protein [Acidimicrobiales bacterium]
MGLNLGLNAGEAAAAPNSVANENALPGSPSSEWDSYEDDTIEGFPTQISVNAGETIQFKVKTPSNNWRIRIFRMGWYQGLGARLIATINPSVSLPQSQPAPATDAATGLVDAGTWNVSASWAVPASALSGVYTAKFERLDQPGVDNRTLFVVRNDGRAADVMLQTSDTTWHAYNRWGGTSLYWGETINRAYKVSYNRPLRVDGFGNAFWESEYPLVRWLERNGYDVCYTTDVDTDRRGGELLNKKVFISSGHDEYWSPAQRSNVEAARNAGVNLIFMTGNEIFWKVRWENSIDGRNTAQRTLVCYKETLEGAKLDPTPAWTGTWRDARFSPPSDGGNPELPLIGQIFGAINDETQPDLTIKVPAQYGKLRFWDHTDVESLPAGSTASLTQGTLGYEWDDDRDLGPKPGGLLELSSTTETVPAVLINEGGGYNAQAATHRLTLYRAASGALVWATGTCQWAWGLDDEHPRPSGAPQSRMQQATANMLADMSALPTSLQSGLTMPTKSTDHTPPTSAITSPAAGVTVPVGTPITITGTASDVGGVVAAVEVSTDNGATWKRAAGTTSWSFTYLPTALGSLTIKTRAIDDSVNIETPGPGRTITCGPRGYPASIWHPSVTPTRPSIDDAAPIEVGLKFRASEDGFVTGVRFYKGANNTGVHVGHLWNAAGGAALATATFTGESASGWQQAMFPAPVAISANTTYVISVFLPNGHYPGDVNYFNNAYEVAPLRALSVAEGGPNGVFRYGSSGFPDSSFSATNYWVDLVFDIDDHRAPTVVDRNPAPGLDAVALDATVSVRFSEAMTGSSIDIDLFGPGGVAIAGSVAYDSATRRATFDPAAPLDPVTTYTAQVTDAADRSGQHIAAPVQWTFTTTGNPDSYPLTLWDTSATPATVSVDDTVSVELGVKFASDLGGLVKGIRFFKGAANTGLHVAHLWTLEGSLLGTANFVDESETGWQQANFATPIPINAGQVYIASYYAPAGGYSATANAFSAAAVSRGVLKAHKSSDVGGNGVFRYGTSGVPVSAFQDTSYAVDVVFLLPPDTTAPVVVDRSPGIGVVSVVTNSVVTATFDEAINQASLAFTLTGPGGAVAGTKTYSSGTRTATFTPSAALAAGTVYTASVSASDTKGNAMSAPVAWSFTTLTVPGATPATIWDSSAVPATPAADDTSGIELGVKFRADSNGTVGGIRFYKGPGNGGAHVGNLWKTDGTLLGTVAFTNETASGWQQANFTTPIPISAGQTYVASYYAPVGRYGVSGGLLGAAGVDRAPLHALRNGVDGGNGVYRYGASSAYPNGDYNSSWYGVDVVFLDTSGPAVVGVTPAASATGVATDTQVEATFGEDVNTSALTFTLRDDTAGANVGGSWAYDAPSRTVTFTPSAELANGHGFTAKVNGAKDASGNAMAAQFAWSFTTVASGLLSFWAPSTVPAVTSADDNSAVELGAKFRVDASGSVVGVRFYKGAGNTGTHLGRVWRSDGTLLGSVTFSGETSSGWQQANFTTPVAVVPGQTYVVSYYAPNGHYAVNGGYFSSQGVDNGVIHALANGIDGPNGVYGYGAGGVFPTSSFNAGNYWVDIAYQED